MKLTCLLLASVGAGTLGLSAAAAPPPKGPPKPVAISKPEPMDAPIPQSVFTMPANAKEGRDPFFPTSTRPYTEHQPPRPKGTNAPVVINLVLNGIIPSSEKPLAMINGKTFARGEEGDVPVTGGRQKVRLLEIKLDSVIVEVNSERRELHLKGGL